MKHSNWAMHSIEYQATSKFINITKTSGSSYRTILDPLPGPPLLSILYMTTFSFIF